MGAYIDHNHSILQVFWGPPPKSFEWNPKISHDVFHSILNADPKRDERIHKLRHADGSYKPFRERPKPDAIYVEDLEFFLMKVR